MEVLADTIARLKKSGVGDPCFETLASVSTKDEKGLKLRRSYSS